MMERSFSAKGGSERQARRAVAIHIQLTPNSANSIDPDQFGVPFYRENFVVLTVLSARARNETKACRAVGAKKGISHQSLSRNRLTPAMDKG
jgi:hypothetical protein